MSPPGDTPAPAPAPAPALLLPARHLFPVTRTHTYLNAAYQTPASLPVLSAASAFLHAWAHAADPKSAWLSSIDEARAKLARLLRAGSAREVGFAKNTSEGLSLAARGVCAGIVAEAEAEAEAEAGAETETEAEARGQGASKRTQRNVLLLDTEHPNHVYAWHGAVQAAGATADPSRNVGLGAAIAIRRVREDLSKRHVAADDLEPYVDAATRAIGISLVMFHSGQVNDVRGICERFRPRGIKVVVDATQAVGFMSVDVSSLGADVVCFGLHKGLNTPAGLGALWVSPSLLQARPPDGSPLLPLTPAFQSFSNACSRTLLARLDEPGSPPAYWGDARRFDGGNGNYFAVACLGAYLDFLEALGGMQRVEAHLCSLTDLLRLRLRESEALAAVRPVTRQGKQYSSAHSIVLALDRSVDWKAYLAAHDVLVSQYRDGVRVSFGIYNDASDVERLVDVLERHPSFARA